MYRLVPILTLLLGLLSFADANACERCGLFGRKCRFSGYYYPKVLVQEAAYQAPSQTIIFNNAIAQPLAPQGSTLYGVSLASQGYLLNPESMRNLAEQYLSLSSEVVDQAMAANATSAEVLRQQGNVTLAIAAMQANSQPAPAATAAGVSKQTVTIRQQGGTTTVESGVASELGAGFTCAKCHSGANAKAGLVFDGETLLDCDTILAGIAAVKSGKMPKGVTLSDGEKLEHIGALTKMLLTTDEPPPAPVPQ